MSSKDLQSLWLSSVSEKKTPALFAEIEVDTVIIGAGITGLTLAERLVSEGQEVCVLERFHVGAGTTGGTSAHLSTVWDPGYSEVISKHDLPTAKRLHEAMRDAIDYIRLQSSTMPGQADFRTLDAFYYREDESQKDEISTESAALQQVGAHIEMIAETPLPFGTLKGMKVSEQAAFHPVKYLKGLVAKLSASPKFRIYESTPVVDFEGSVAVTPQGRVRAKHIVHATHTPVGISPVQAVMVPTRSFMVAGYSDKEVPDALFWDCAEPYHYIRKYEHDGRGLILIGGADKQTGHQEESKAFEELKTFARQHFGMTEFEYQWSAQFYEPSDFLPIIGRSLTDKNTFMATGFSGDGLTMGTAAAHVISDLILGLENPLAKAVAPLRFSYLSTESIKHNLKVAKDMVIDRVKGDDIKVKELKSGEGCVAASLSGPKAYYCDDSGEVHEMSAVCPHLRCVVRWNGEQKSFDCPCHGSRFGTSGEVLEGPAQQGLEQYQASPPHMVSKSHKKESSTTSSNRL